MFTLKLYRRKGPDTTRKTHKVIAVDRVVVHEIGETGHALELTAYLTNNDHDWETYYVGDPEPGMDAHGRNDLHLDSGSHSWWGWGLLENAQGNTSEHYRPASYG
jgi:hypothetical protein